MEATVAQRKSRESRLDSNDLVVTTFLPSLGRTAVYAHYEEEPCREQMMTGEFSEQRLRMRTSEAVCRGTQGSGCSAE